MDIHRDERRDRQEHARVGTRGEDDCGSERGLPVAYAAEARPRPPVLGLPPHELRRGRTSELGDEDEHGVRTSYALTLHLHDIATAPAVVDAVSGAAGDALRLGGFHLLSSATGATSAEAGAHAVEDARQRAESTAQAAGMRVGRVLAITEAGTPTPPPVPAPRVVATTASSGAAVLVETGSLELTARVTVRFEIID
jgi:hypothetical protein